MKALALLLLCAGCGFFVLFSPWTKEAVPFWLLMPLLTGLLAAASLYLDRSRLNEIYAFKMWHIPAGVLAAFALYTTFWVGRFFSVRVLPFAATEVESIYTIRSGQNTWTIAAVLLFIIGPAEEVFWRGFIQRRLSKRYGVVAGVLAATLLYALVHVWSFNFMLIAAAAVCGAFWGFLLVLTGNLWPCILSHALWDVTIFILFPVF